MDPRTFLPPASRPTAAPPTVGAPAPALPAPGLPRGPAVVAFLRHTGCPFAEATLRALRERASGTGTEVTFVAVSHAPAPATARWLEAIGGAGEVVVIADPDRHAYAAWGLGRTSLAHFTGRRSLLAVGRLARRGVRNRHPSGSRWQAAETFAVDAGGIVRARHLPEHAGDLPDLDDAVRAARGTAARA